MIQILAGTLIDPHEVAGADRFSDEAYSNDRRRVEILARANLARIHSFARPIQESTVSPHHKNFQSCSQLLGTVFRFSNGRSQWFLRIQVILFLVLVKLHQLIRLGEIVVAVDEDMR